MLYQHQLKVLEKNESRLGIWHDVGLGKTVLAIQLAEKNGGNYLIITTKSLKENWRNEIAMWTQKKANYHVVSKEEFRRDWELLSNWDGVIVDEFHYFGNFKSALHKALYHWLKKNKPRFIWGLTATPIMASCLSVWALSRLLGRSLGSYWEFFNKYFYKIRMGYRDIPIQKKGIEKALAADLRSIGSVVSKEEALDLPEQIHKYEYFELTKEQNKAIKDLDNDPATTAAIVYNTKCLQIANGTLKTETSFIKIPNEKIPRLLEIIGRFQRVVIVARHTAELFNLREHLPDAFLYYGGIK